jgi:hypothetical protein
VRTAVVRQLQQVLLAAGGAQAAVAAAASVERRRPLWAGSNVRVLGKFAARLRAADELNAAAQRVEALRAGGEAAQKAVDAA